MVRQKEQIELLRRRSNMVSHGPWICSGFCAIYAGNQRRSQVIGEVRSLCLCKGKGSQIDCASHTTICLISLGSKIYDKILARRMQEKSERLLWDVQGGFRPGKECIIRPFPSV